MEDALFESSFPLLFFNFIENDDFINFTLIMWLLFILKLGKKRKLMIIWEMQKILRQNNKGVIVSKLLHHFLWVLPKSICGKIQIQNRCEKLEWRLSPAEGKTTKQEQTSATKSNNVCCMRKYKIVDPTQLNENICKEQITYLLIFFNRLYVGYMHMSTFLIVIIIPYSMRKNALT